MSSDPLRDARYPNRPQHDDFWRMSEVWLSLDADSDGDHEALISSEVDPGSMRYMAVQRAMAAVQANTPPGEDMDVDAISTIAAAIIDGFMAGVRFQQRGGHRAG
jgi:hypothetical protein